MTSLNILLVGNGGREHALAWRLAQSPTVSKIFVAPGNGGTGSFSSKVQNIPIGASKKDFEHLVAFAQENDVGLVIPGPEQPLVEGISDYFKKVGIPVFGPSAKAAVMEGSKTFSKVFMKKHNIPTAKFENFTDYEKAKQFIEKADFNVVIKASGLAAGKGVLIPSSKQEAVEGLKQIMVDKEFGEAGDEVVIEEYLEGDELSILAFSDGYTVVDLPPAQDHKRAGDGDTGLNTGGMGAYSPTPIASPKLLQQIRDTILQPTIDGMRKDGIPFVGMLFTGIMLTNNGTAPKVLEYNVRFGDPETQTVLPLISKEMDFAQILLACAEHRLDSIDIKISNKFATTVVLAAGGYPSKYEKGDIITIDENKLGKDVVVFHAGTSIDANQNIVTSGGRVIAVTAIADDLKQAIAKAYAAVDAVSFKGKYNRKDIAHRAFKQQANEIKGITYADAGVSIENGSLLVEQIKAKVRSTARSGTNSEIGGFGGIFDLKAAGYTDALLVGATDGVGTKLIIAQSIRKHDTVGIDLVAMNVNDLVVQGAEPLFFLDYYASGKLKIEAAVQFVSGVAEGCLQAGCALIGGETAEMPGIYHGDDYDANGTCIGAVNRGKVLPKTELMRESNVLLGLASSGIHSNGFSLVRKIVEHAGLSFEDVAPWDKSTTVGRSLLIPTKIYVKQLLPAIKKDLILGMAHITGGGLIENVPRALPSSLSAIVDMSTWPIPPVFKWLGKAGNVPVSDILKTLNIGIGMVIIVEPENVTEVTHILEKAGEKVFKIGTLTKSQGVAKCEAVNTEGLY